MKNYESEKRKRGAPIKVFTEDEMPRSIHTTIKSGVFKLLPHGRAINDVIEDLITAAFGDSDERELAELRKEAQDLEYQLSKIRVEIHNKEQAIQRHKELQNIIKKSQEYALTSFRLLFDLIDSRSAEKKISMDSDMISQIYGISFNVKKCNENWELVKEMPDEGLISYLSLKKLDNVKSKKDVEILDVIRKKEGGQ